jgi:hypothetical protein
MSEHLGNSHDYLCPKCKTGNQLSIEIKVWATLSCDGTDIEGQDHEWDDANRAICRCGWEGKVKDFIVLPEGEGPISACQNCETEFFESQLDEIKDFNQRVSPGEVVPSGQCPSCGSLCHLIGGE